MNFKTTIALVGMLIVVGAGWLILSRSEPERSASATARFLEKLNTDKDELREIQFIASPDQKQGYTLTSSDGKTWSLPGNWPVRSSQVQGVVDTLTKLNTRFRPYTFDKDKTAEYGLDDEHCVIVKVRLKDKQHTLRLGEGAPMDETNQGKNVSSRPTYLRLDDRDEIVRVGPGVIAALRHDVDFFRKRQLFKVESVVKEDSFTKDKSTQAVAEEIAVAANDARFTLRKKGKEWSLADIQFKKTETDKDGKLTFKWENADPALDRVNPQPLTALLEGLADFWGEAFWSPDKLAKELALRNEKNAREGRPALKNAIDITGLASPQHTITVKAPGGQPVTLEIGGLAREVSKTVSKVVNIPQLGPREIPEKVEEKFHFARIKGNDEIFEVKIAKLKEVAADVAELRDPRLARFQAIDVAKIEIQSGGNDIVLAKDKDKWRIEKPIQGDAQATEVMSLLDKLSGLEAKKEDILAKDALAKLGKETSVATIKLHVEVPLKKSDDDEEKDDKSKDKKPEVKIERRFDVVFRLSTAEKQKDKFLARVEGWPRVNVIDKDAVELAQREPVAYRNRNVLDLKADDLAKLDVARGKEGFSLSRDGEGWKLTKPTEAKTDADKVKPLLDELVKVEALKFVSESPKAEDLEKYGLKDPKLTAVLTPKDGKNPTRTLRIGKQVDFKDEYYARLDDGPVFLVKKATVEAADKDSLAFRAGEGWNVAAANVDEIKVAGPDASFTLKKGPTGWKFTAPFDAAVSLEASKTLLGDLTGLKIDKLVADSVTDLAKFGLDKPFLKVEVSQAGGKDKTVSVLSIGKAVDSGEGRYARIGDNKTIFVVAAKLAANLNRPPLDYVSKELITLDAFAIEKVKAKSKTGYTLTKDKEAWQITDSPAAKFTPDAAKVRNLLEAWGKLNAEQIAEMGPKIDWKKSGLEPPEATITVELKDGDKTKTHTLELGREVGVGRYARLDKQNTLAILNPGTLDDLALTHLDFLPLQLFRIPQDELLGFERKMKGQDVEIVLREEDWFMEKPQKRAADKVLLDAISTRLQNMTAKRVAAYPAGDVKEYGLDAPVAEIVVKRNDDKKHTIKLGKAVASGSEDRYARIDDGGMIVVLGGDFAKHLVQPALYFADRNLLAFGGADRVDYEKGDPKKGGRKLVFIKTDGRWTVASPVKGDADEPLVKTVESLSRLRVDEIVADKADPAYGLDKPAAQWHVFIGDNEKLHMLVGAPEKGSEKAPRPRRYGQLAKKDQVFLLSADMAERLLEEYRTRKPWTSLDAAQVQKLSFKSSSGSFILDKQDNQWTVAGNAKAKVAAAAVTDTLDTLAGLKAVQFYSDNKTDAKVCGLEPPELTIEVTLPTGKRTLHVGRPEGETKQRYAMADGVEGIFILSEADAAKLLRGPDAYVEDGKQ